MSKRRKNAGEGYGFMFSGAYSEKKDAVAKEKKRKGSFIKGMPTRHGYRYVVMTPRTNPIRRRKRSNTMAWGQGENSFPRSKASKALKAIMQYYGATRWAPTSDGGALITLRNGTHHTVSAQQIADWANDIKHNPSELLVLGANPHESVQEITLQPGAKLIIRNNPAQLQHSDDSRYMIQAAAQLYPGRHLASLNAAELSRVAQLAAKLKLDPRHNIYFGFGPAPASEPRLTLYRKPRGVRSRSRHSGESHDNLRSLRADVASALVNQGYKPAKAKQMAREASGSDFSSLFNDALRQNPLCGAMIGGYSCTRKPGHRGPHLPQGATMRTRHRLPRNWQPNPSAEVLRERFTGAPVGRVRVMDEPHLPAGDYAMLGKLLSLYVKPFKGGQIQEIRAAGGTMVVADESARQIYFVGGDQDISSGLAVFGAVDRGDGLFELGEARRIDYKQRKEHVDHPEMDSWRHEFGEETGERPIALYDSKHKRILLEGGQYVVRAEGIIN